MFVASLLDRPASWLAGDGPDGELAINCRCRLVRNLADYAYPERCREDERRAVEERVVGVLESLNLMASGTYWSLSDLDPLEIQFLIERHLIEPGLASEKGTRGVYIADDQSLSLSINGANHLTLCGLASGLQFPEVWARINLIDDTLAGALDFAFEDRLGYLTSAVSEVGTALKASAILHLPALALRNEIGGAGEYARERRHSLTNLYPSKGEAPGDLYVVVNTSTLGRSEEETLFHVKHVVSDLIAQEKEARSQTLAAAPLHLEDRAGRALGLAQGARLLAFNEALAVLSSLRLGIASGLIEEVTLDTWNDVFIASHDAHIEMRSGHKCDELTLSAERADLFRTRFT